ncbi:hypothetical protein [Chitinophaga sp. GbtcB8]|uniref:hypothetical protein n=1 Tax=Chitinophaga sp. GbtcB8 TaxID=2824753 RepID=UPI001C2FED8E|nr:hypothetical protein [Chitinophaga sp. GbtcB8]
MEYATANHMGNNHHPRKTAAKKTSQRIGLVLPMDATPKGRKRNQQGQAEMRTDPYAANDFLRTSFLPKLKENKEIQHPNKNEKTERDFYQSLSQLAEHFCIEPIPTRSYSFPYNVCLSLWDTQRKLKEKCKHWDDLRLVQDGKKTYLTSEERYRTGATLYYVPVAPLYRIIKDPQRKETGHLLLSVCSYLYHIADIPYFRQEDSYLYWQYVMLREWVEMDEESDSTETYLKELHQSEWIGGRMEQKVSNRNNLTFFKERINGFKSRDEYDRQCCQLAKDTLSLYMHYPNEKIFRNAASGDTGQNEDDYYSEMIGMEKYISFVGESKGWLYENLTENVNNDFNELGELQEPVVTKRFNGKAVTGNLDFENSLFEIIEDLCYLLNNYKRAAQ